MWWVKKKIAAEQVKVTRPDAEAIVHLGREDLKKRRRQPRL
jgi:hypothetical protein